MALTFLVEIGCLIAGVQSTLRYSWAAREFGYRTRPTDTPANTAYLPKLTGCTFRYDASGDAIRLGSGQIVLENTDGALDDLLDYVYDSQTAKLLVVDEDDAYTLVKELARWTVEQPSDGNRTVTLVTRSPVYNLEKPLQSVRYGGTGGIDGGTELTNKPKPLVWGWAINQRARLVDSVKLIFQLTSGHDITPAAVAAGGTVADLSSLTVYDEGLLMAAGAAYASVADMNANAPTGADDYRVCNATASGATNNYGVYIRLQSPPAGEVTFGGLSRPDCSAASTFTVIDNIIRLASGAAAALYGDDANNLNTTIPYGALLNYESDGEPATYLDALRAMLGGNRGWVLPYQGVPTQYGTSFVPPWAARWLDTPATATPSPYGNDLIGPFGSVTPYLRIDGSQITSPLTRDAAYDLGWPEFRVTLLYDRLAYVQTQGLAATVSLTRKARLALEFLSMTDEDLSVQTPFPTAVDRTITTAWSDPGATLHNEATRQLAVFSEHHPTFTVGARVDLYHGALTVPGDPMDIVNYAHQGCDVSRTFLILGMELNYLAYDEGANTIGFSATVWA